MLGQASSPTRPAFSQIWNLKIRPASFMNYINSAKLLILRFPNCERIGRAFFSIFKPVSGRKKNDRKQSDCNDATRTIQIYIFFFWPFLFWRKPNRFCVAALPPPKKKKTKRLIQSTIMSGLNWSVVVLECARKQTTIDVDWFAGQTSAMETMTGRLSLLVWAEPQLNRQHYKEMTSMPVGLSFRGLDTLSVSLSGTTADKKMEKMKNVSICLSFYEH